MSRKEAQSPPIDLNGFEKVYIHLADGVGGDRIAPLAIFVERPIPSGESPADAEARFERDAEVLVDALAQVLPHATIERALVKLLERRVGELRRVWPPTARRDEWVGHERLVIPEGSYYDQVLSKALLSATPVDLPLGAAPELPTFKVLPISRDLSRGAAVYNLRRLP